MPWCLAWAIMLHHNQQSPKERINWCSDTPWSQDKRLSKSSLPVSLCPFFRRSVHLSNMFKFRSHYNAGKNMIVSFWCFISVVLPSFKILWLFHSTVQGIILSCGKAFIKAIWLPCNLVEHATQYIGKVVTLNQVEALHDSEIEDLYAQHEKGWTLIWRGRWGGQC